MAFGDNRKPLARRTGLVARVGLSPGKGFAKPAKGLESKPGLKSGNGLKQGKALRHRKPKNKAMDAEYIRLKAIFLKDNPYCVRCMELARLFCHAVDEGMEPMPSGDLHHEAGREGERLIATEHWVALCRPCHKWTEDFPKEATAAGYVKTRQVSLERLKEMEQENHE